MFIKTNRVENIEVVTPKDNARLNAKIAAKLDDIEKIARKGKCSECDEPCGEC